MSAYYDIYTDEADGHIRCYHEFEEDDGRTRTKEKLFPDLESALTYAGVKDRHILGDARVVLNGKRIHRSPIREPRHGDCSYVGTRTNGEARIMIHRANSQPMRLLDPRLDLANHSPDGFEWSYGGSGPAQLALALIADALGNDDEALEFYQRFKNELVAQIDKPGFRLFAREVREYVCFRRLDWESGE